MQVIIPMSGIGQRFLNKGYKTVKSLIFVDRKPIIQHIVELFPINSKFIFICNNDHLKNTNMRKILKKICKNKKIIGIEPHKKGPVYAVSKVFNEIDDNSEVIVNYCDFGTYWNYNDFLKHTRNRSADGAIVCYKGFHPHMLQKKNYAFVKEEKQWMEKIQEKKSFTDNRMNEYASNGTYYFKKGSYIKKYFQQLMNSNIRVNNEFYVSMVYNLMKEDNLNVSIYQIQHMLQWGTPEDLEQYLKWSDQFNKIIQNTKILEIGSINLIPMSGIGKRFSDAGYKKSKPFIEVSGKPMFIQALNSLPIAKKNIFVCLKEHFEKFDIEDEIKKVCDNYKIIKLDELTNGQAITCEKGLLDENKESSVLIASSDNAMIWDRKKYKELINNKEIDIIVWSFKDHILANEYPEMYGWLKIDENEFVKEVSVKKAISNEPFKDNGIIGTFYFRKVDYFFKAYKSLVENNIRVNNEFYVDSMINEAIKIGLKVKCFEVDHYISFGTPQELKIYKYWQSYFHKSKDHFYSLEKDITMNKDKIKEYNKKYNEFKQEYK